MVTVVDPETVRARAGDKFVGRLVRDQLSAADLVLVSRADLATAETLNAARQWLAEAAPGRPFLDAAEAAALPDLLLGPALRRAAPEPAPHPAFDAALWTPCGAADPARLRAALDHLSPAIHRAKGLFQSPDGPLMAQRAGARTKIAPVSRNARPGIVLIAAGPEETRRAALTAALSALDAALIPLAGDAA